MMIMMVGVIFIEPDVDVNADADADAEVMSSVEKQGKVHRCSTQLSWS